jgi:hypothetical protein
VVPSPACSLVRAASWNSSCLAAMLTSDGSKP